MIMSLTGLRMIVINEQNLKSNFIILQMVEIASKLSIFWYLIRVEIGVLKIREGSERPV